MTAEHLVILLAFETIQLALFAWTIRKMVSRRWYK